MKNDTKLNNLKDWLYAALIFVTLTSAIFLMLSSIYLNGVPKYLDPADELAAGGKLVFSVDQVNEFNRVYERREREWSWCMDVDGVNVSTIRHPKDVNTSQNAVSLVCSDRYADVDSGLVHTHPSGSSILSREDKLSRMRFTCLVHDVIDEKPSENPANLKCVEHVNGPNSTDVEEVEVRVEA